MDELDKLLQVGFEIAADEKWRKPEFRLADDGEDQRRDIQRLLYLAVVVDPKTVPHQFRGWAYELRPWAWDKLIELAGHYHGKEDIPVEMIQWSLGAISGNLKPPKRPRKRPSTDEDIKQTIRNRLIIADVNWLKKENGHTWEAAIRKVADAAGLSTEHVVDITSKKNTKE